MIYLPRIGLWNVPIFFFGKTKNIVEAKINTTSGPISVLPTQVGQHIFLQLWNNHGLVSLLGGPMVEHVFEIDSLKNRPFLLWSRLNDHWTFFGSRLQFPAILFLGRERVDPVSKWRMLHMVFPWGGNHFKCKKQLFWGKHFKGRQQNEKTCRPTTW